MIPCSDEKLQSMPWQIKIKELITDVSELVSIFPEKKPFFDSMSLASQNFPLRIPRSYAYRLAALENPEALLIQFMPSPEELKKANGYSTDPLLERKVNRIPGLLHKYQGRVLLSVTQSCAIHCRYCFRRYFPYQENNPGKEGWEKVFSYIRDDSSITEVILSGGDPFSLSDNYLSFFLKKLDTIQHVKIIRFHTRFPVIIPERITPQLVDTLTQHTKKTVIVFHINHWLEINAEFKERVKWLHDAGIILLNQSVLLRHVNDSADVLKKLSFALFDENILPYYLHQLDKVSGAHHFSVSMKVAKSIYRELHAQCPGYLLPRLVREISGQLGKTSF